MNHPVFEIVTTTAGAISIRNKVVNEIMHNPVGPWKEANALYIEQSQLHQKLKEATVEEYVIFDIGLGAAANALAALACIFSLGENCRPVRIISFERDLELLQFALDHANQFEHFRGYEVAIRALLQNNIWSQGKVTWELRHGDFLEKIEIEKCRPHLIFFDPYSPKVNREMWSVENFAKLRQLCRDEQGGGSVLYTYSQATPIRVAMILAGFFIGSGEATGLKKETTQASSVLSLLRAPLSQTWFERWKRSQEPFPFETVPAGHERVRQFVKNYMRENFQIES